jgi:hypothetical protein
MLIFMSGVLIFFGGLDKSYESWYNKTSGELLRDFSSQRSINIPLLLIFLQLLLFMNTTSF